MNKKQNQYLFLSLLLVITLLNGYNCVKVTNNTTWDYTKADNRPIIIAHRGYASLFPENTMEAFRAALYSGADFIELDVQITKDRYLVVAHDPYLSRVTNVDEKKEFAHKKRFRTVYGLPKSDWWICDFTLEELLTLNIKQSLVKGRDQDLNTYFRFPLLSEVIEMVLDFNKQHQGKRNIDNRIGGIVIESKNRQFQLDHFNVEQGQLIVDLLAKYNLQTMQSASEIAPIILHSFDEGTVKLWHEITDLPNSQLSALEVFEYQFNHTAQFATTVGLHISTLYLNFIHRATGVVANAHTNGLMVHAWTFRDDSLAWGKDSIDQYTIAMNTLKLDGIITEFPEAAITAVTMIRRSKQQKQEL